MEIYSRPVSVAEDKSRRDKAAKESFSSFSLSFSPLLHLLDTMAGMGNPTHQVRGKYPPLLPSAPSRAPEMCS